MKSQILKPTQVKLACHFWKKKGQEQGSHYFHSTPLSLLQRTFGAARSPPWFEEGSVIDIACEKELACALPLKLDHSIYFYRVEVTGDGFGCLKPASCSWGITKYTAHKNTPVLVLQLTENQKKTLAKLFTKNRLSIYRTPFHPLSIRLNDQWVREYLNPMGIDINFDGQTSDESYFFDMWFNLAEKV